MTGAVHWEVLPPPRLPTPPSVTTRLVVATLVGGICGAALGIGIGRWSANRRWRQRFHVSSAAPDAQLSPAVISLNVPPLPGQGEYWVELATLEPLPGESAQALDARAWKWVDSFPYWVDRQPLGTA